MGLVVDVGSGQSSQSLANRRSRAEAAAHSHSQSQEPTAPNPMGVPLKNGVEAAPDSEDEALTIPSQQWHTGEPNPFDSRYGGSKLDLVVPAACMIRIEMGCRCCLLRKLWGPSSPIQRLREMPSDGSGSRLYLEAHPDVGKTNTAVMYGMRDVDAKPILFCHRAFSSCVSIGEARAKQFKVSRCQKRDLHSAQHEKDILLESFSDKHRFGCFCSFTLFEGSSLVLSVLLCKTNHGFCVSFSGRQRHGLLCWLEPMFVFYAYPVQGVGERSAPIHYRMVKLYKKCLVPIHVTTGLYGICLYLDIASMKEHSLNRIHDCQ
ncbi:hypothetical protein S83_065727 [Arachis hypogaea]